MSTKPYARRPQWWFLVISSVLASLLVVPAAAVPTTTPVSNELLARMSQSVAFNYWFAHPEQAPEELRDRLRTLRQSLATAQADVAEVTPQGLLNFGDRFNRDQFGLPQNEESVSGCRANPNIVLGGTNDYRGLLDPQGNFTGWHLSTNGGKSVTNEGLLPPVPIAGAPTPSGGDPVVVVDDECNLYAASLNYDPADPVGNPNGVGVYKTTVNTLATCGSGSNPACWPTRRAVAQSQPSHFLDKEWFDVGKSGAAGKVVWVAYADFTINPETQEEEGSSIFAVRCDANLSACTKPILISGADRDVQFADVTIGPDGRTYITWTEILGELEQEPQTFIHKLRVAPAGSTTFGPERIVHTETQPIPFGGRLHANDFRVATYPKNTVKLMDGSRPRIFVVWDACAARILGETVCEEPQIKLTYSDDDGGNWSEVKVLSMDGDNYFPTIADDPTGAYLAVAWFTNRRDPQFHNRQDVELATIAPDGGVVNRQFLTQTSNESEADPGLGGFFIGDYIEVFAHQGTAYVHYNANYRSIRVLGQGFRIPQQDNYLTKAGLQASP